MPLDGVYHQHLDKCSRCMNQPFNLCPLGAKLLVEEFNDACKDTPVPPGVCPECRGDGDIHGVTAATRENPDGVKDERCPKCRGTGRA